MNFKKISIVVSVYNEEEALPTFWLSLKKVLDSLEAQSEVLLVNDGSRDNSKTIIGKLAQEDARIKGVHFSRNYGHENHSCFRRT